MNYGNYLAESGGQPSTTNGTGSVLLTDASGTEQLNFSTGSTIFVQVTDGDRNADENTQETITATVVSETDTDGETVTLTETGVSSGVFLGSVSSGLSLNSGDLLTVTYVDPADDFGNEVTLTDNAYYNVTLLSGEFTESQTWTAANSPYLVTGDLDFLEDASLTIEPGVEVRFIPNYDDRGLGDANRTEIRVERGNIVAVGTEADSIIFTTTDPDPTDGDWGKISRASNATDAVTQYSSSIVGSKVFRQLELRNNQGNNSPATQSDIRTMYVENCTFQNGGHGLLRSQITTIIELS